MKIEFRFIAVEISCSHGIQRNNNHLVYPMFYILPCVLKVKNNMILPLQQKYVFSDLSCNHLVTILNCSSNWTYQIVHQSFLHHNVMWFIAVKKITQSHNQTKHYHLIISMSFLMFSTLIPQHKTIIRENWKRVWTS